MGTFLFDKIVFGPVQSRRLGVSLGINLLPVNKKICTFDCIYCECGFNGDNMNIKTNLPSAELVLSELDSVLKTMYQNKKEPNVITFAGNGEPTIHPDFDKIIDGTINLRNSYFPNARIAVLSNATIIHKDSVFKALKKVDDNILKLDSGLEDTIKLIDRPNPAFSLENTVNHLMRFEGDLIIQTMFLKGTYNNTSVDNTTDGDINSWLELIKKIKPKKVMIYSIERDTPANDLEKVNLGKLKEIASLVEKAGFSVQVSG